MISLGKLLARTVLLAVNAQILRFLLLPVQMESTLLNDQRSVLLVRKDICVLILLQLVRVDLVIILMVAQKTVLYVHLVTLVLQRLIVQKDINVNQGHMLPLTLLYVPTVHQGSIVPQKQQQLRLTVQTAFSQLDCKQNVPVVQQAGNALIKQELVTLGVNQAHMVQEMQRNVLIVRPDLRVLQSCPI